MPTNRNNPPLLNGASEQKDMEVKVAASKNTPSAWGRDDFHFQGQVIQRLTETINVHLDPLTLALGIANEDILRFAEYLLEDAVRIDIERLINIDPAVSVAGSERARYVLESYKGVDAILNYRVANALIYRPDILTGRKHDPRSSDSGEAPDGYFLLMTARRISEEAASRTSIEINPAARIGPGLVVDHGARTRIGIDDRGGIVVGETCEIGKNCTILNDVVLGARSINTGEVFSQRRHPKLGDNVTIGAGVRILGGITVGDGVTISPGCIITQDVPSRVDVLMTAQIQYQRPEQTSRSSRASFPRIYGLAYDHERLTLFGKNLEHATLSLVDRDYTAMEGFDIAILSRTSAEIKFCLSNNGVSESPHRPTLCVTAQGALQYLVNPPALTEALFNLQRNGDRE